MTAERRFAARESLCECRENEGMEFPNLDKFIAAKTDEERLALGVEVLRAALEEARSLPGWQVEVHEYLYALESGKGLNRPL